MLDVRNLHVGYGPVPILRGLNFTVAANEIVVVLGRLGAGKTTLNRALSGLLRPIGGSIRFFGTEIAGAEPAVIVAAGLIHVPEGRKLFPNLTVRENLQLGGYRRGRGLRDHNIAHVTNLFPRLKERMGHLAGRLPSNEQQMLALARGLMGEPRLLVLDEPSLGLSPRLIEGLFGFIARLREQGCAVLLTDQNATYSLAIADRGYVLRSGVFETEGSALALKNRLKPDEFDFGL